MNSVIKLLLAEDEPSLGLILKESLSQRNFEVTLCENGKIALEIFTKQEFDVLVLDVMMPQKDGLTLAREIKQINKNIPIIFLTSKSQTEDVVRGFEIGCHDYIKKPFSMEELIVRINSILQRVKVQVSQKIHPIGQYQFNTETQELKHYSKTLQLTHRESALLLLLIENKTEMLERSVILQSIWGKDDFFNGRSMDVFITKLRKKLSLDPTVQIINSRGRGYKIIG
jgi:DNA-binding response OmpR family regulator